METTTNTALHVRDWSIDRIHLISKSEDINDHLNAIAISEEFSEWIDLNEDDDLNYMCMEWESVDD